MVQTEVHDDFPMYSSQHESRASEEPFPDQPDVSKATPSQDFTTPPPTNLFITKEAFVLRDGTVPDVEVNKGSKSKRPRTLSSKLDGRFHFDKKTKLLVGHPSPLLSVGKVVTDPEERYQRSLSKIKGKISISIVGKVFLSPKEISDIIERKKQFTSKVMDALIKCSRHLLRTNDIDGETLMFDVLGSKFVSQLTRLFSKCFKS
ncbi:hypothetical protein AtEden1_Chr2g0228411 [Arabidopsis thaliana]